MLNFTEKFLYHIWDAQHLRTELLTVSGKPVKVKFHGRWNTGKGPDFKNAIIEIDSKILQGDVEIHKKTYDWNLHQHSENKSFNNVILHVVYKNNSKSDFTIKEDSSKCEILELEDKLDKEIEKLLHDYPQKEYEEKEHLCNFFAGLSQEQTIKILEKLGSIRFNKKLNRLKAELELIDFDQLLFQDILEALGYSKNKFQMLQVGMGIPYLQLKEFYRSGMKYEELISLWLGSFDLFDKLPRNFPSDFLQKWKLLYARQKFINKSFEMEWNLFRLRPANNPAIRLIQISGFIYDSFSKSITAKLLKVFSVPEQDYNIKSFKKSIYALFSDKYGILPEKYQLGKQRIDTIITNIILPFMGLYCQKNHYDKLHKIVLKTYLLMTGNQKNYILRHLETGMEEFQKKIVGKKSILQQGCLELYHSYCEYHVCNECARFKAKLLENM